MASPLQASAGTWNLQEKFADRENVPHSEIVQEVYSQIDAAAEEFQPVPIELKEIYEAIFEPPAVKIPFRVVRESAESEETLYSTAIYYSQGEIVFVDDAESTLPNRLDSFITVGDDLYTWAPGAQTGEILSRFTGDTVELVDFLINPIPLMRYLYLAYSASPEAFSATETNSETFVQEDGAIEGLVGIRLQQDPLWLSAGVFDVPPNETASDTDRLVVEIDPPIPLETIPPEIQSLPEGIIFEPSENTVNSFLPGL
ncbi:MAG: hypothetical protein WBB01_20745 [Phormidesmis sp.]